MAARMRSYLQAEGIRHMRIANAQTFGRRQSKVSYREPRHEQEAAAVAALLGSTPTLVQNEGQAPDIVIELGHDLLAFDYQLWHSGAD